MLTSHVVFLAYSYNTENADAACQYEIIGGLNWSFSHVHSIILLPLLLLCAAALAKWLSL